MVLKVFFLLATLALVILPTTVQQQQQQQAEQQCVSKADFDNVVSKIAAIENTHSTWQNASLHIFKRFLLDNPALLLETVPDQLENIQDKLENIQHKMEQLEDKANRLLDELATLRNTTVDGQANLQDKVDTLQDKVINLQDKFQNTTETSNRKSLHGNITEDLQDQLKSCNGTDISIQYLPTSCNEIAELNPHSPPGYYKISTTTGAVYCSMTTPDDPASSCHNIATQHPLASSGYYWVNSSNGTAVHVYCDMERHCCGSTGGWMRAAYLNMTDPSHHCPTGFRLTRHSKRSCERIAQPGCTGLIFAVHNEKYSKVCGKVIAYQFGGPDAFSSYHNNRALDAIYVDGVSITHGHPRRHIWTFAAATDEGSANRFRCPCTKIGSNYTGVVPPFVGNEYFCDTGSRNHWRVKFYPNDPLWDGRGCGTTSSCCTFNSPPWFCKELPQPTNDDIEVRVCTNYLASYEDIMIEAIELYVQ